MLYWVKQISNPSSISIQNPIPVIPQFQSIIQCGCQNIFAIWGKFHKTEKTLFGLGSPISYTKFREISKSSYLSLNYHVCDLNLLTIFSSAAHPFADQYL